MQRELPIQRIFRRLRTDIEREKEKERQREMDLEYDQMMAQPVTDTFLKQLSNRLER